MRYTFLSTHCVQGVARPAGETDVLLFEDQANGIRVLLTADAMPRLHLLNRHLALLSMMLRAMVGTPLAPNFPELLLMETAKIKQQRRDAIGSDPVMVIEISGDVEAQIPATAREIHDFILCFDAFDKKGLEVSLQSKVSAVLTGLRIGTGEQLEFRKVADGSYLVTDDGRVVHSASVECGSQDIYISRGLGPEQRAQVAKDIALTLKAGSLERVIRLHTQSLNKATDNYRAFVAAWSALEILIAKLFPTYQRLLAEELQSIRQSPGLHAYLDRIAAVMGDKFNLADKFAVLSVYLDDAQSEDEVRIFRNLKTVRDRLSHGEEVEEVALPTRDVQRLFDKYLRNHLRREA